MFNAPLSLTTETAFELPAYLYESGTHNAWVVANLHGRDIHSFLRGPCFDNNDCLWVADVPFGRIFRITPTGEWDLIVRYDGWPMDLKFHPDGRLIVADARHGLLTLDPNTQKLSPLLTHCASQRFKGLAGVVLTRDNDLFFSDAGQTGLQDPSGALFRAEADSAALKLMDGLAGPTGVALSSSGGTLFVSVQRDNAIWRVPLMDGVAVRVSRAIQLTGGVGPDGIIIDDDDNLSVAHYGMGCVWHFDKRGEPKYRIDSCRGDWTTGVTKSLTHPNEFFITEAQTGTILKATLPMY